MAAIILKDCWKRYTYDLDKAWAPEETCARVKARFSQLQLDLLKNTLRIDSGRLDIPVYISLCGIDAVRTHRHPEADGQGVVPRPRRRPAP